MNKRYILFGSLMTMIIFVILGIFNIYNNEKETIYVKDLAFYTKRVTELRKEIEKLEENTCKASLTNMLNRINETHFAKNITIREYYNAYYQDDLTFLNYFEAVKETCELSEEKTTSIYITALASTKYPNEIKKRYLLRHEFLIKDIYSRRDLDKNNDEIGTYTTKYLELQVITDLLSEVKL